MSLNLLGPGSDGMSSIFDTFGPDVTAWSVLLPLAQGVGMNYGNYMAYASMTKALKASSRTLEVKHSYINGEALGWWEQTNVYCCTKSCPSLLSSIGSALGYGKKAALHLY